MVLIAVIGDPDAAHQFHHEIRPTGVGRPRIEHAGDVGMVHQGQRLAFRFETRNDTFGVHSQLDDFEGHASADRFLLFGHVDDAATALADALEQFVVPDAGARAFHQGGFGQGGAVAGRSSSRRRFSRDGGERKSDRRNLPEETVRIGLRGQQRLDPGLQIRIPGAGLVKKRLPRHRVGQIPRGVEHYFFLLS